MKKPVDTKKLLFLVLKILDENDGVMPLRDLMKELDRREGKNIPEEKKRWLMRDKNFLWQNSLQGRANIFVKAGYIRKEGRDGWRLLPKGQDALEKGSDVAYNEAMIAAKAVPETPKEQTAVAANIVPETPKEQTENEQPTYIDAEDFHDVDDEEYSVINYERGANNRIKEYIDSLEPYAFQDLCAALFRGMGYHVRDVAPPGPDGGVDFVAYTDPLGSKPPRIKVQVKHIDPTKLSKGKKGPAPVGERLIRELAGLLVEGDIGVFISSYGFAKGSNQFARNHLKHIHLIDYLKFIELWMEHYGNLSEKDKSLFPLKLVYFLDEE